MQSKHIFKLLVILSLVMLQSCATSYDHSYEKENYPIFEGDHRVKNANPEEDNQSTIKVVSFNIKFAQNIDEAILLLQKEPLNTADVFLLQEMDENGTIQLAKSLNMSYIYYPATLHPKHQQNFGNAILSKWDIKNSKKIKLPYSDIKPDLFKGKKQVLRRTATVANIDIRGKQITFASAHAAVLNTTKNRKEIAKFIATQIEDPDTKHAVVGGDFNTLGLPDINATAATFADSGFQWASQSVGITVNEKSLFLSVIPDPAFQLDHLFVKGLHIKDVGKVNQKEVSDHLPIWVDLELERKVVK